MANHKWSSWQSTGHGSGDGTPAGVVSSRTCTVCRAQEWRDSAVSDHHGNPHPARGFRDSYGNDTDTRPDCLGYDPLTSPE